MNQFEKQEHFFDKRTIFAIVIVMAVIFGWQIYLSKKYPMPEKAEVTQATQTAESTQAQDSTTVAVENQKTTSPTEASKVESWTTFNSENISFDISSRGMGLRNITLHKYTQRDGSKVVFGRDLSTSYTGETIVGDRKLFFNVRQISENEFVGTAVEGETEIEKHYTVNPENYTINTTVQIKNAKEPIKSILVENINEVKSSFLMPSFDHDSFFAIHDGGSKERVTLDPKSKKAIDKKLQNISVVGLGGHYFTTLVKDKSPIAPELETTILTQTSTAIGYLSYVFTGTQNVDLNYLTFLGPKDTTLLASVDEEFIEVIDFGIFSWIAKPILSLLKLFYSFIGNYGVAIILVTLIIRMILLPLNISSFKSMKKMQEIQPQLKALKEKYKKNPQQLQIETMNLMKVNKVNPLGGCLPMLLQLPIFIALYNVLAQSIELYQAPFMLWITDLSLKDPYFVLPILMGATMYIQQKITPSTLDPAQAKAMQVMPVIFSLLMISLPSGLTLYIFISTLFGILQQYYFMNDKKQNAKA